MNLENKFLVAIDAGSSAPRLVVARPPLELQKDEALTFAAHLVACANTARFAAKLAPLTPLDFGRMVKTAPGNATRTAMRSDDRGTVCLLKSVASLSVDEAFAVAAELVASADPDADMVARVVAVVTNARGELDRVLEHEGHSVKLGAPMRTRLDPAADVAPPPTVDAGEHEEHEAAGELKKMRR